MNKENKFSHEELNPTNLALLSGFAPYSMKGSWTAREACPQKALSEGAGANLGGRPEFERPTRPASIRG
ncbi:hypothetical protein BSZ35_07230 [Salinibacter sp. 10B]|nr:hypothetical protein BSZ35_07230 [Salinibacter sp. 10B]